MKITVESAEACRRVIRVEASIEEVAAEFKGVLDTYVQAARLPGFRPGRAPRDMVRRRYAKEIVQDVKDRLIPQGYQEAIRTEKIEPVNVVDVKDQTLEEGSPFVFTVTVDAYPEFTLPTYKGIALAGQSVEVADADVDAMIQRVREQSARYEEAAGRPLQAGDLAQVDFTGTIDGQPVEAVAPKAAGLGQGKDFWAMLDADNEVLPGLAAGLIGAAVGDRREVKVAFPAEYPEAALAGKEAVYSVDVRGMREKKLPALDEAFFQSLHVESEAALRSRVREDLDAMKKGQERNRLQGEIIKFLLQNTTMTLPESIVAQETSNDVYDIVAENTQRGVPREELEGRRQEIFEAAARSANERVRVRYILGRIAKAEKIEVTPAEFEARIHLLAQRSRTTPEKVRADVEKRRIQDRLEEDIRREKALVWLFDNAVVAPAPAGAP